MSVYVETWDETTPPGTGAAGSISLGDDRIRELKRALRERLAADHKFLADETGVTTIGYHLAVHMIDNVTDPTAVATTGIVYSKTIAGVIELFYIDAAGNITQLTRAGQLALDKGRLPNDTYLIARNAADGANVNLFKLNASNLLEIMDGAVMASSAAPTADAGIANKKYVDDQIAAIPAHVGFGAWAAVSNNTVYQATTDGFVLATTGAVHTGSVLGYTDSSNPPTTLRLRQQFDNADNYTGYCAITMPVRKGDYWKVTGASTVYWIPIGS